MKIIHCECGLGNQMCYYANYLAVKKSNPEDKCYFETALFDIPEMDKIMKMWNGYELEKVFGINVPNIKEILNIEEYENMLDLIKKSEFWKKGWYNSKVPITEFLSRKGLYKGEVFGFTSTSAFSEFIIEHRNFLPVYYTRTMLAKKNGRYNKNTYKKVNAFKKVNSDKFYIDMFSIIQPNSGIEEIKEELFSDFKFPEFNDEKNKELSVYISTVNSVSIHVRKSDCFKYNADCFKFGYFKRSVDYIKKNVDSPVFIIFSDDKEWVINNLKTLGLSKDDSLRFVDWNNAENSFRDMQLMSMCKHNISTNSTFGFWASWLNKNPNKITCSPKGSFDTTNWF